MNRTKRLSRVLPLPDAGSLWLVILVSVLQGASAVALLATSAWLISRAAEMPPVMYLMVGVVGVRAFALGRATFRYLERIASHDFALRQTERLRPRVFKALIPFYPAGLKRDSKLTRNQVLARFVEDTEELQNLVVRVISPLAQSILVVFLTVAAVASYTPVEYAGQLALSLAAGCLIAIVVAAPFSAWLAKRAEQASVDIRSELSAVTAHWLQNFETIEYQQWHDDAIQSILDSSRDATKKQNRASLAAGLGQGLTTLAATASVVCAAWIAASGVQSGSLPGVSLAVQALVPLALFELILNVQPAITAWMRYLASAARVDEVLTRELPQALRFEGERSVERVESIRLEGVSIRYPGETKDAVGPVDFELKRGDVLALVGPSGSGKTSLAYLLSGFIQPRLGSLVVNGVSSRELDATLLRKRIGYLEQQSSIFAGTLRANLLIAKPSASDQELWVALDRVGLRSTFESRGGLDVELGESASQISGGEAQRVALARALLADFDVLVLDEPTSNVSAESALQLVSELIQNNRREKSIILVTHNDALTKLADRVVRL